MLEPCLERLIATVHVEVSKPAPGQSRTFEANIDTSARRNGLPFMLPLASKLAYEPA